MKIVLSPHESTLLKGLAIGAVVGLHLLSTLPRVYTTWSYPLFWISLDQLLRFCVPLFIVLSGYGLTIKYWHEPLQFGEYIQRRTSKLFPLYLWWSLASVAMIASIPVWVSPSGSGSLLRVLLTGSADYQLYFFPLIFQLYLLFPWLLRIMRRHSNVVLALAFTLQFGLYVVFDYLSRSGSLPTTVISDILQYVLCLSWIGYFVLGMWLAQHQLNTRLVRWLPLVAITGLIITCVVSWQAVTQHGDDPLIALRFTRVIAVLWIVPAVLMLIVVAPPLLSRLPRHLEGSLARAGRNSFLIFLAHTILLRIGFSFVTGDVELLSLVSVFLVWLACVLVSRSMRAG